MHRTSYLISESIGYRMSHAIPSLGLRAADRVRLGERVHSGLPAAKVLALADQARWTKSQLFEWAHIPPANGHKRFREGRFTGHESERIARLAMLFDAARAMLRDPDRATEWLTEPNTSLGGVAPIVAGGTEIGAAEVFDLVGRLRHGVF